MRAGSRRLIALFVETVPDAVAEPAAQTRLTRLGQFLLAAGIGLLGLVAYLTAWSIGESTSSKLQICPVLGQDRGQVGDLDSFTLTSGGDAPNMLLWNYKLNQELVAQLKVATKPQRLLLNQQIASLTIRMSRQCYLVRYYRIQAGALAAVSTGAAVLLVIVGLVRVPRGLGCVSRSEQAILTSSLAALVLSIGYLTLGGQQKQVQLNWGYHKKGIQLFSLIRSSLATNQLLLPAEPTTAYNPTKPIPLNNPESVGILVTRIDSWLFLIDQVAVGLDNSFARHTFDNLFQGQSQEQPVNPLLSSP